MEDLSRNREVTVLFVLLRAGLWEKEPEDLSLFPLSGNSWRRVYRMARRQTVTGPVYRGVCRLPDELLPPEELLMKWLVEVDETERRNRRMNQVLATLYGMFRNEGMDPVLQKGQGIALLYEIPLQRECGDIDFYFPDKEERRKALRLVGEKGIRIRREANGNQTYVWNGIRIEHHARLIDLYSPLLRPELETLESAFGYRHVPLSTEEETLIRIPSPTLNMLLLGTHVLKHAIGWGIGLRQLCDMARACHRLHEAVDPDCLRIIGRKAGIAEWNRLLHSFLKEHLGVPEAHLPYPDRTVPTRPLLERMLEGGNFGWYREGRSNETQPVWQRKLHTARMFGSNIGFSCRYAPKEAFWIGVDLLKKQRTQER